MAHGEDQNPTAEYELRRRARRPEPQVSVQSWRKRILMGVGGFILLAALVAAIWIYWEIGHVRTVGGAVHAELVMLSPDLDAYVAEKLVRPGDRVTTGQVVARMDDSRQRAAVAAAEAARNIKASAYAQAKAQYKLSRSAIGAEIELAEAAVEAADAELESARAKLDLRRSRLQEEIRAAQAQRAEAQARLDMLKKGSRPEVIQAARARLEAAKALVELHDLEVRQSEELFEAGVESAYALEVKKTRLETQKQALEEAQQELSRILSGATEEEIQMAAKALEERQASLALTETTRKEIEALTIDIRVQEAQLRRARARLAHARAREAEVEVARQRVEAAAAELAEAEAQLEGERAALAGLTLKSPVAGLVVRTYGNVGELWRKGERLAVVSDESEGRWIEAYVPEQEAHQVAVGQKARAEVVIGSGDVIDAVVTAVGLSTARLDQESPTSANPAQMRMAGRVWVKLRPANGMIQTLPGASAQATIRVD